MSHQAVLQGDYREIDIVLFGKMLSQLPQIWEMDCYEQLRKSVERLSLTESQNSMDFWYEHLWWSVIYDLVDDIPLNKIEGYIDEKVAEAYFDESIVNNHLAAVGLCLMKNI